MEMDEKTELSSTDSTAEILEPPVVSLGDEVDSQVTDTSISAGTDDASLELQTEKSSEVIDNDTSTLISELNDVSLSTANTDADTFLESLTSETENPVEESAETVEQATDVQKSTDTDMPVPTLALPLDVIEQNALDSKDKHIVTNEEKDPVCTLEEELQRMHEGEDQGIELNDKKSEEEKLEKEEIKPSVEDSKDKVDVPIMRDSDLEEMLSADEVLQDPPTIIASQDDMKSIDILVCGKCHEVFNFIEEFQEHKSRKCTQRSQVIPICEFESKPQVWGFTLWKNKQVKALQEGEISNDWDIYKKWCLLSKNDKDAWISAGQTLQYCNKIGNAKLTEIKVKMLKDEDKDPLALDCFDSNKENSTFDTSKSPLLEVKRTVINKPKAVPTTQKVNDPNSNRAMRTVQSTQKSEYAVERIVAKRFNPKKKTWEYQIKWEHFPSEDNTWEPLSNLNHCRQMVDEFEEQLKKLKAEKNKQNSVNISKSPPKIRTALTSPSSSSSLGSKVLTPNRPQRTSKQKALDQVKAWCGNISDEDTVNSGIKRSRSPDSDESFEKRLKFEDNSEDSEPEVKPKLHYRKIAPKPPSAQTTPIQVLKNGLGKNTPLPQNILIPDANGVVRINQKQLPSLSTGVYIMSKTAGIIKLDSNTSKVATSGGQTIVKVAPKIGQTQIKIMKKDGTSTQQIVQMSPKSLQNTPKAMQKHLIKAKKNVTDLKPSPIVKKTSEIVKKQPVILTSKDADKKAGFKKVPEIPPRKSGVIKISSSEASKDEESDDGLEELPFPDEIKIPEPEENEDTEFTLDPSTGKIAGMEYPDIPDPEPIEETKSDMSLDNIVKLAAADITEEDLKNEPQESISVDIHEIEGMDNEEEFEQKVKIVQKEPQKRFVTASPLKQVVKMSVTPRKVAANPTSILNKALTGPQVVRRTVTGSQATQRVQQRILNQSVARSPQMVSPVVRQINTYVRTKPTAPKPRFNISSESKFVRPIHETSPKNVYTYARPVFQNSSATRKIGSTTIRSASTGMPIVNSPQQKTQTKLVRTSSGVVQRIISPVKKEQPMIVRGQPEKIERKIVQSKPKTVISMPSLMSDDEILLTTKATSQKIKPPPADELQEYHVEESANLASEESATPVATAVVPSEQESQAIAAGQEQAVTSLAPDMSSFTLADNENPIFITGDDGTVYQVAGQNEQGQTILLTQGSDGQQQCLLVTNEVAEAMETSPTEDAQSQPQEISMPDINTDITEPLSIKTDPTENNDQVVAQVVRAEPPSPGGTHKVVVMLPDGNLMVTQVSPEEYASLELE